jgi:hypothetical protein
MAGSPDLGRRSASSGTAMETYDAQAQIECCCCDTSSAVFYDDQSSWSDEPVLPAVTTPEPASIYEATPIYGPDPVIEPVAAPEPWAFDAGTIGGPAAAMPSITLDAPITFDAGTIGGPAAAMPPVVTLPADAAITPSAGIIGGIYSDDSVRFIPQPQGAFTSGVERFPTDGAALHDVNLYNQNWRQTAKLHDGLWATEMSIPGLVNHDYDWTTGRTTIER